ncbi:hypothetical protein P7D22_20500 [Lichenihabitans sp. Uapishka_5]|uniref:hypothetical protein n=1 Tax=Lichenihabitans sp. Uapishka_5 TaxID=3037302 RepID=UPI0029E8279E|nr:hypothetical protein [Lichenihabitans sp. Uapishka_5]MDX7953550.1 hypothetical protein [Lichenihabitans sp. Uapishka_5]
MGDNGQATGLRLDLIDDEVTGNERQQAFAHPLGVQRVPDLNDVTLRLGVAPEVRKDPAEPEVFIEK